MSNNTIRESKWYELLLKFENRNENVESFCKRHKVSSCSIYKWRGYFNKHPNQDLVKSRVGSKNFIPISLDNVNSKTNVDSVTKSCDMPKNLSSKEKSQKLSKLSSSFKIIKSDLSIEFVKGCSLVELRSVLEIVNATK